MAANAIIIDSSRNFPKKLTMPTKEEFIQSINAGYTFKGEAVQIGAAVFNGEVVPEAKILLPLKTMNRHGLIAGATGTGKTMPLAMNSRAR